MTRPDPIPFEIRLDHPLLAIIARQRAALEAAHHALTTLHGLVACDGAAPGETWTLDESATIAAIDAALEPTPAPAWLPWPTSEGPWWIRWTTSLLTEPCVARRTGSGFSVERCGVEGELFPGCDDLSAGVEFCLMAPPRG